jgi:hypothetical protein
MAVGRVNDAMVTVLYYTNTAVPMIIVGQANSPFGCSKTTLVDMTGAYRIIVHHAGVNTGFNYYNICGYGHQQGGAAVISCIQTGVGSDVEDMGEFFGLAYSITFSKIFGIGTVVRRMIPTTIFDKVLAVVETDTVYEVRIGVFIGATLDHTLTIASTADNSYGYYTLYELPG